jgi:O-antigen biosynthesis protein
MLYPIKVVDIEFSQPIPTFEGLETYMGLQGLVRLHGVPLGYVKAPISLGRCTAANLSKLILEQHSRTIICQLLKNGLASPQRSEDLTIEALINLPPVEYAGECPLVTVAVCTRDRPNDMKLCLEAISKLDYPHLDILVVDNAPQTEATKKMIESYYPEVRYVREPRPGLDWARNRAALEAKGEIIAYTDDDVVVDSGWVKALAQVFVESPEVMAVTGLVVPYELETKAQVLFEEQGGFGKGFERKWFQVPSGKHMPWWLLGTGNLGTGANMAYRRSVFDEIGFFDPALDVGTVTNGAGDLEMFYRVLKSGHTLVYEPNALTSHRHRSSYEQLRKQIFNNGSVLSYFVGASITYPDDVLSFIRVAILWIKSYHLPQLVRGFFHPKQYPTDLIWAELTGCFIGLTLYQQAKRKAQEIETQYKGIEVDIPAHRFKASSSPNPSLKETIGVYKVEITKPIQALNNLSQYSSVKVFVTFRNSVLGSFDLENNYQPICKTKLGDAIAREMGLKLVEPNLMLSDSIRWNNAVHTLTEQYARGALKQDKSDLFPPPPPETSVSIIIGTFDRPEDLRECLQCLVQQDSPRRFEIIVVDNHPASGITPSVVAEFPSVKLVYESRQGVAYARNAGIAVSTGDIVITIDDDVTMPSDWMEKLIAPFSRADIMCVTSNVLPKVLETPSQQMFERYGGLGRGFTLFEVANHWFERSWHHSVPTWELGGTANAAFRANVFHHPDIGLMDETLGPGMPSGVGEDIYLFYKVLKAGYTISYEPDAQVWHKHRRTFAALRRQLYNYSKGFVSYQLTTLLLDQDRRSLFNLLIYLPLYHLKRIYDSLRGQIDYPVSLVLLEVAGNVAGPWSLWQSYRRVKKAGRSQPYVPVHEKSKETNDWQVCISSLPQQDPDPVRTSSTL